jgi:transcriptional regulator with XRE-family HTH domain
MNIVILFALAHFLKLGKGRYLMLNDDSHQAIGIRLKLLRKMAGLDQETLAKGANVSKTSISYWETSRSKVKMGNLRKLIQVIRKHGVEFDEQWLLRGVGIAPRLSSLREERGTTYNTSERIQQVAVMETEMKLFLSYWPSAIIVRVDNDNLAPCLKEGDYVAGDWQSADAFTMPFCGVIEENGQTVIRYLTPASQIGYFHVSDVLILDERLLPVPIELVKIAQIVRVWR